MPERRNKGKRRWGLDNVLPLNDCNGLAIIAERRRLTDRRLGDTTLEERLMMFAEMPLPHSERKKRH